MPTPKHFKIVTQYNVTLFSGWEYPEGVFVNFRLDRGLVREQYPNINNVFRLSPTSYKVHYPALDLKTKPDIEVSPQYEAPTTPVERERPNMPILDDMLQCDSGG